ncbi:hypothetical protein TNCT_432291 [Trichonephila clavata]|uniref:Uncharacterized protein n=1 Tax=Trichonephila clavata TaxID=2740835 RepID=A0A8X6GA35_TRICU|nr:hypothetical protein TNCT_432291 [Trichonephila clavata]
MRSAELAAVLIHLQEKFIVSSWIREIRLETKSFSKCGEESIQGKSSCTTPPFSKKSCNDLAEGEDALKSTRSFLVLLSTV